MRGVIVQVGVSVSFGEALAGTLPRSRSVAWGAAAKEVCAVGSQDPVGGELQA